MTGHLYQPLTEEELTAIVGKTLHTALTSHRLLTGGLFNTTYLITTSEDERLVLRVGPINRHLLMPFEHRLMEAECIVYDAYRAHGIPTSEVVACDTAKRIINRDFMIVRYIPSHPMNEVSLTDAQMTTACREIGKATAVMHNITSPRFGRIAEVNDGGGFNRFSDFLFNEFTRWEQIASPSGIFTPEERAALRGIFQREAPLLDEISTPTLVHTDLWLGNILVTDDENPAFAAIIDADRAIWGDPQFEFSSICWMINRPTFWEGYGKPLPADKKSCRRREIYALLNKLWNAYVYLCEYAMPEQMAKERDEARGLLRLLNS